MTKEQLIPAIEFCARHEIEFSFINSLHEFGLIEIITIRQTAFLNSDELPRLEQIILFNKELEINLEGVEVIMRLLERVHQIQNEMNMLKSKLGLYEN
ncbi:MerR-like DNA binding protein [Aquimarina sp. MAR_2010_214]|uniref:chaperone modulator CbpM n=1 Tax=Aquimarina sp. MAR_2010_214 TaxID=1250026 RepID=UPI000C70200B|nr:chaperone modulator CbpM [Aquimarina sp. MAR_2010_214]PKV48311.1 MerR-like DNA binding protein [Aquimarina sp. MAR_2010_214]